MTVILHNPYDEESRHFLADNSGIELVNWYDKFERDKWLSNGGTLYVSAFPSVSLDLDILVGGGLFISRRPTSIQAAIIDKKIRETELLISQGDNENAQAWIDELDSLGLDITKLQAWLDEVKTP